MRVGLRACHLGFRIYLGIRAKDLECDRAQGLGFRI